MARLTEDAGLALLQALRAQFAGFAGSLRIEELVSTAWASVTFHGARHRVRIALQGAGAAAAADAFLARMGEAQFDLPGHIVADIAPAGDERSGDDGGVRLTLEALTVEDD